MVRTLSCGEMQKNTFKMGTTIKIGDEIVASFTKNKDKSQKDGNSFTYKIKPGARIVKIKNKEDLKELVKQYSDKSDILSSTEGQEKFIDHLRKTYEGLSVEPSALKELSDSEKSFFNNEAGIKIFNPLVITFGEQENTPFREGFKAKATELTKEMKELSSFVYENGGVISSQLSKNPTSNYNITQEGDKFIYSDKENNNDIEGLNVEIESIIFAAKKTDLSPFTQKELKITHGKCGISSTKDTIEISSSDCLRAKDLCSQNLNRTVTAREVVNCLALYAVGLSETNNDAYEKAYSKLNDNLNLVKDVDDDGRVWFTYTPKDNKYLYDVSKEVLHKEKMAWNYALQNANEDQKELIKEMAKLSINTHLQTHLDNKLNEAGHYSVGDLNVTFENPHITKMIDSVNQEQDNSFTSKIPTVNDVKNIARGVGSRVNSFKNGTRRGFNWLKTKIKSTKSRAKNALLGRIGNSLKTIGNSLSKFGNSMLPN